MKKFFDLGSLTLSNSGGVVGAETALEVLSGHALEAVSGAAFEEDYTEATNNGCTNSKDCGADSTNRGCTNTASNCSAGTNSYKCVDSQK